MCSRVEQDSNVAQNLRTKYFCGHERAKIASFGSCAIWYAGLCKKPDMVARRQTAAAYLKPVTTFTASG